MTIDERTRKAIIAKRGRWSQVQTAEHYGICTATVRKIWNSAVPQAPRFKNPLYSEIVEAMVRYESAPFDDNLGYCGLTPREDDLIDYLFYLDFYGEEAIATLRDHFKETPTREARERF